jgi:hypothetical protein
MISIESPNWNVHDVVSNFLHGRCRSARAIAGGVATEDGMRLSRSKTAEAGLACGFVLAALALAALNSAALAQSSAAVSHDQTIYEKTTDPRATGQVAAAPAFPAELVRFLSRPSGGSLRMAPAQGYYHEGAPVIGPELRMGVPLGATSLAPERAVAAPEPDEGCLWGLKRYNGVSCP